MIQGNKILELKNRYNRFKERGPFYKTRIKQLELGFVNWARNVLLETLKAPLTNERLTGLIQMLKNGSKKDNIFHYLEKNIINPKERKRIIDSYNKMGETGFTGGAKGGIVKPLKVVQLKKIQSFLLNSARVKNIDEGIELVENFESLHIPEIKHATYSPWLYYINPEIFPIKNKSNSTFIAWCEQPTNSYPVAIKLFHEVSDILGEKELGLIDAFTHVFSDEEETETNYEQKKNSTMSLNIILYGPPGTGKTYHTIEKAVRIINPKFFDDEVTRGEIKSEYDRLKKEGLIEFITFHQSMSYEDFIEGIKPKKPEEGDTYVKYEVEEGIFKKIAKRADYKPTVLIIDEINRGNIAQIFGELITLIETDKRKGKEEELEVLLPYSKEVFSVPPNLYIIGTMNTADRSVEALDTALRRRFEFEQILPQPELLLPKTMIVRMLNLPESLDYDWEDESYRKIADSLYELLGINKSIEGKLNDWLEEEEEWKTKHLNHIHESDFTGINLKELLLTINSRILKLLDADHQIGHAFFMNAFSTKILYNVFYHKILPQLQEYFYGDFGKIGLILGNDFVTYKNSDQVFSFAKFDYEDQQDLAEKRIYNINHFQNEDGEIDYHAFVYAIKNIYPR